MVFADSLLRAEHKSDSAQHKSRTRLVTAKIKQTKSEPALGLSGDQASRPAEG